MLIAASPSNSRRPSGRSPTGRAGGSCAPRIGACSATPDRPAAAWPDRSAARRSGGSPAPPLPVLFVQALALFGDLPETRDVELRERLRGEHVLAPAREPGDL